MSYGARPGYDYGGSPPAANGSPEGGIASRFPVYQIDFAAVACGKRVATTKRRIRWRFGFSNKVALENGETGIACRGEEHDVTIVWSIAAGKRLIMCDGQEVHFSTNRSGMLEYNWSMKGNHVLKVICHAAPQMSPTPGFRQYDLHVDGQSFFSMPKVYELGIKGPPRGMHPGMAPNGYGAPPSHDRYYDLNRGSYVGAPTTRDQEEADLRRAIEASIQESRAHLSSTPASAAPPAIMDRAVSDPTPAPAPASDLLDMGGASTALTVAAAPASYSSLPPDMSGGAYAPPAPAAPPVAYPPAPAAYAPAPAVPPSPPAPAAYTSSPPPAYGAPPPAYGAPPPAYGAPPESAPVYAPAPPAPPAPAAPAAYYPPPAQEYAPASQFAPEPHDPFAPQAPAPTTFTDISSSILGQYGSKESPKEGAPLALPSSQENGVHEPAEASSAIVPQLSINTTLNLPDEEGPPKSELEKAMSSLVNFDDISSPVEKPTVLTMKPKEEEQKPKKGPKKSKPIPPPAAHWGGVQPSLSEMQKAKPTQTQEKEPVMKAPAYAYNAEAAAGALVVYGAPGNGPPPIVRQTGFGVGASMTAQTYTGQQQQMPSPQYGQQPPAYGAPPPQQYAQPPPPQQYAAPPAQYY